MPVRKNTKNQRRVRAARAALDATKTKAPRRRRRVGLRTSRRSIPMSLTQRIHPDALKYIDSLRYDILQQGLVLPSSNYNGSHHVLRLTTRFVPPTDASGNITILCNPRMLWSQDFRYEVVALGALSNCTVPSLLSNSTACPANIFPRSNADSQAVGMNGQNGSASSNPYQAHVRVQGIQYRVEYTGPNSGKGGTIFVIHNPKEVPMIQQSWNNALQSGYTGQMTAQRIQTAVELTSEHYLGTGFRHVWRPTDLSFHLVSNYIPNQDWNPGATDQEFNPDAAQYLPYFSTATTALPALPDGWISGLYISPATKVIASATSNYVVTVEALLDIDYRSAANTMASLGQTVGPSTHCTYSDPISQAAVHNALANLHHQRSSNTTRVEKPHTGLEAYAEGLVKDAKAAASDFTIEQMTRAMASVFQ
jgi:hypothetical protein